MPITDRYLKDPASFPTADQGEPWGEEELWIDFVGGPYRVSGLSVTQLRRLEDHFKDVRLPHPATETRAVEIQVRHVGNDLFNEPAVGPRELSFDLRAEQNGLEVAGEALCARIHCAGQMFGTLWTSLQNAFFTRNVFENFFRILVTYKLLEDGGLLLHSAGIVSDERAYLFPGRSGAGKSTLAKLSLAEGRSVLSDDMNAVTWREDRPWVEKVPFTGDLGRTWARGSNYPLQAIVAIEKASSTTVRDLGSAQAMSLLTACAPYLNSDPFRMPKLLENIHQLTLRIPTHILAFPLSGGIWSVIEEYIHP